MQWEFRSEPEIYLCGMQIVQMEKGGQMMGVLALILLAFFAGALAGAIATLLIISTGGDDDEHGGI